MKEDILIFRHKDATIFLKFRIVLNPTNEWVDMKIYDLNVHNFQVDKKCIAKGDDMLFNGEGRKIYSSLGRIASDWEKISCSEIFRECISCTENSCPPSCRNVSVLYNI